MSSSSSTAGGQVQSRHSTPATDVSPPGSPDFVLPPPTAEMLRRRAQSDRASSEIGARMLKGWAMLSDECLNDDCWAIPLVRPPRARPGAQPDPRKECVACGTVYLTDESGQLVAQPTPTARTSVAPNARQPTETSTVMLNDPSKATVQDVPRDHARVAFQLPPPAHPLPSTSFNPAPQPQSAPAANAPFASATRALEGALDSLSQRLTQVSMATDMDVKRVKETAEAVETVMRTLHEAQKFSRSI